MGGVQVHHGVLVVVSAQSCCTHRSVLLMLDHGVLAVGDGTVLIWFAHSNVRFYAMTGVWVLLVRQLSGGGIYVGLRCQSPQPPS